MQRLDLGDDVQVASVGELHIDVAERFEPPPNFDEVRRTPRATARILPCVRSAG
jgi:hypothetical protein